MVVVLVGLVAVVVDGGLIVKKMKIVLVATKIVMMIVMGSLSSGASQGLLYGVLVSQYQGKLYQQQLMSSYWLLLSVAVVHDGWHGGFVTCCW